LDSKRFHEDFPKKFLNNVPKQFFESFPKEDKKIKNLKKTLANFLLMMKNQETSVQMKKKLDFFVKVFSHSGSQP